MSHTDLHQIISSILEAAVHAPSGDNNQPWRFEVTDNKIDIFGIERETDVSGSLSLQITIGTLIENIHIAADHFGFDAAIQIYPNHLSKPFHIAQITLTPNSVDHNVNLFHFLSTRHTNRYPYKTNPLPSFLKNLLCQSSHSPETRIVYIEEPNKVARLAKETSTQSRLIFSHKLIHRSLFSVVTKKVESRGIYIEHLGLNFFERIFTIYILRYWGIVSLLNLFGLRKIIHMLESRRHKHAAGFFVLLCQTKSLGDVANISAGRTLQNLWLTATKYGVALQPSAAIFLLYQSILDGRLAVHPNEERKLRSAISNIRSLSGCNDDESVLWVLRAGIPDQKPKHQSLRLPPNVIFH